MTKVRERESLNGSSGLLVIKGMPESRLGAQ